MHKPDDAEILKAIGEVEQGNSLYWPRIGTVLSDRLHHLEGLINNNGSNVVNGFVYMRWLMSGRRPDWTTDR